MKKPFKNGSFGLEIERSGGRVVGKGGSMRNVRGLVDGVTELG